MVLRKLSQNLKITMALMLSVLSSGILQASPAYAYSTEPNPDPSFKKVWVCKYVGTPGVNESLKNGNDGLVSTATSSIPDPEKDGVHLGDEFSDKHERSVVIAWDDKGAKPSADLCPSVNNGNNEVTPLPLGISDVCGPNNDTVPSEDTENYVVENDTDWVNNSRTVTYRAEDGLVFSDAEGWVISADGKTATYTYTDWATPCDVTPEGELNIETSCEEITLDSSAIAPEEGVVTYKIDGVAASEGVNQVTAGSHKVELFVNGTMVDEETVEVNRCSTVCSAHSNTFSQAWTYDGDTYPATDESNGTYTFKIDGLHLSTPDNDSTVYGLIDAGNTPIQDVDAMGYKTFRKSISSGYAQTAPAYVLAVDVDGSGEGGVKYFFYEPYNNGTVKENEWQIWDAIDGGNAMWWTGPDQVLHTWDYFVNKYPDAVVLAYGFNQGTYNPETYTIVNNLVFDDCGKTVFWAPQVSGDGDEKPTQDGGGQGGGNVLGDSTSKPATTGKVLATSTELPETLPATGGANSPLAIIIASLLAYGAAYFLQGRRKLLAEN